MLVFLLAPYIAGCDLLKLLGLNSMFAHGGFLLSHCLSPFKTYSGTLSDQFKATLGDLR